MSSGIVRIIKNNFEIKCSVSFLICKFYWCKRTSLIPGPSSISKFNHCKRKCTFTLYKLCFTHTCNELFIQDHQSKIPLALSKNPIACGHDQWHIWESGQAFHHRGSSYNLHLLLHIGSRGTKGGAVVYHTLCVQLFLCKRMNPNLLHWYNHPYVTIGLW